jgi:hypothetical protein
MSARDKVPGATEPAAACPNGMENPDDPLRDMPVTLTSDDDLGDWLRAKLTEEFSEETQTTWAVKRVYGVTGLVQRGLPHLPPGSLCP